MGSKPWRTLSVLVALSALTVGCNTGPQKDNTFGATAGNPPRNGGQSLQTAPQGANMVGQKPVVPSVPPGNPFNTSFPQANQQAFSQTAQPSNQPPVNPALPPFNAANPSAAPNGLPPFNPIQQTGNVNAGPTGPLPALPPPTGAFATDPRMQPTMPANFPQR